MRAHADDLVAVLDHLGLDRAVLAGHSMGAYVATTAATAHPTRWSHVVLVDGGVALPLPRGVDPDDMLAGVLGPALARLEMTFADRDAYHDFWRAHPALAEPGAWNEDTEAWLDHDLIGTEPELRSSASLEAVRFDGTELLVDHEVRRAFNDLTQPAVLLRAPRGLLNQVPPLLPDELIDPLRARWPIRLEMLVDNTNHYSILLAPGQGRRQPPRRRVPLTPPPRAPPCDPRRRRADGPVGPVGLGGGRRRRRRATARGAASRRRGGRAAPPTPAISAMRRPSVPGGSKISRAWSRDHSPAPRMAMAKPAMVRVITYSQPSPGRKMKKPLPRWLVTMATSITPITAAPPKGVSRPTHEQRAADDLGEAGQPGVHDAGLHAEAREPAGRCRRSCRRRRCG